jgi:hypothetical protein
MELFFNIPPANEMKHNREKKRKLCNFDPENIKIIHLSARHPSSPRPPAQPALPGSFAAPFNWLRGERNSKGSLSGSIKIFALFCFYVKCIQIYS